MQEQVWEKEVTIEAAFPLKGTLALPENGAGKYPVVLIVGGTGENDRNGNGDGFKMNTYKKLSDFLISIGYATLRYDKRGTHASEGDFESTGLWDFVEDAEACVRFIQTQPEIDSEQVYILGHSEGATIATLVQTRQPVQGLMLIAGFADTGKNMLAFQTEGALQELSALSGVKGWVVRMMRVVKKARQRNKAIFERILKSEEPVIRIGLAKVNAKWIREHYRLNILDYFPLVTCPTLAITGDRDIQVKPEHVQVIAEKISGPTEWHLIPEMNHILVQYSGKHTMLGIRKEYKQLLDKPLHPELLRTIKAWLEKQAQQTD